MQTPPDEKTGIAITVAYAISFSVALVGNSLIIHIIRKNPSMKTKTNLFLVNMAVADLLIAFSIIPFSVYRYYKPTGWFEGFFGIVMCKFTWLVSHVALAGSIITLVVMALERFIAIIYLLRASPLQKTRLVSFIIWFLSVLVMSPIVVVAKVEIVNGTERCMRNWSIFGDQELGPKIFYTLSFLVLYILPLILMLVLYSRIGWKLWRRKLPGNQSGQSRQIMQKSRRQVIRLLVTIVSVFGICWLPIQVMNLTAAFRLDIFSSRLPYLLAYIGHCNSAINPCLCLALNRKFRRAFLGMFTTVKLEIRRTRTRTRTRADTWVSRLSFRPQEVEKYVVVEVVAVV